MDDLAERLQRLIETGDMRQWGEYEAAKYITTSWLVIKDLLDIIRKDREALEFYVDEYGDHCGDKACATCGYYYVAHKALAASEPIKHLLTPQNEDL